jgi:DNA-binding LytR/AlgR family response regulator
MTVFIVEDEAPAANRLSKLVHELYPETVIAGRADSIESAVRFFVNNTPPDLVFMDIQLADGLSFDIFSQVQLTVPVIFTTAFDQYTLKAFKVNSIDYLLKPIDEGELKAAIEKHRQLAQRNQPSLPDNLANLLAELNKPKYRERLMIKRGSQYIPLKTTAIAYCYADGKLCYAVDAAGARYTLEDTLSDLEAQLKPSDFYRINRHMIVQIDAIKKVHTWLGARLKLEVTPETGVDTVVSRDKVTAFKDWLDGKPV